MSDPGFTITHRRVLAIAVPMTLASATTPLLGVVATAAIGRLGVAHLLGAVAMASVVFDCLFWLFGFLRMGTVALTAQALGARDVGEERATLVRALMVAGAIGIALILLQWPIATFAFSMAGASEAVTEALSTYFFIRIWAAPFTLAARTWSRLISCSASQWFRWSSTFRTAARSRPRRSAMKAPWVES